MSACLRSHNLLGQMEDEHHVESEEHAEIEETEEDAYADAIEFHGKGHSEEVVGTDALQK